MRNHSPQHRGRRLILILIGVLGIMSIGGIIVYYLSSPFIGPLEGGATESFELTATKAFTIEQIPNEQVFTLDDLLANIDEFVTTPDGGVDWRLLGETGQEPYSITDADGMTWSGVRPRFSEGVKKLDGSTILIQGYMFPLGQDEQQSTFLLGPFPVSCPFHYHVTPNLIIEAHARNPIAFSYDAVTLRGTLELVPADDYYNVFYRLKNTTLVE